MITPRQIKAARALAGCTTTELGEKTNLAAGTITNIENGKTQAQESTMSAIIAAFDKFGIEFTEDEGVKVRKNEVRVFSGIPGYKQFLDHIYYVMKNGGRICQFNASDGVYLPHADEYVSLHLARMSKIKDLDARVLTVEGDFNFTAPYCQYRWLHKENKVLMPYYVYGEFLEMPLFNSDHNIDVISIHSNQLASQFTEQFDLFWDSAIIPPQKG